MIRITISADKRGEGKSWAALAVRDALTALGAQVRVNDDNTTRADSQRRSLLELEEGIKPLRGRSVSILVDQQPSRGA